MRKVCEQANELFLSENKCNVRGLVLAGCADIKTDLESSRMLSPKLQANIIETLTISYGSRRGLEEAVHKSAAALKKSKMMLHNEAVSEFFSLLDRNEGTVVLGVRETLNMLEMGLVKKLIVDENMDYIRVSTLDEATGEIKSEFVKDEPCVEREGMEVISQEPALEWLLENYKKHKCELEMVSDRSSVGTQFVKLTGGMGAILKYKVDLGEDTQDGSCDSSMDEADDGFY